MRTVLACHDELHRQRRDFLNAVNDYNVEIAEYAATVAGNAAPDRLVAMLIHVKPDERVSALSGRTGGAIQLPLPPMQRPMAPARILEIPRAAARRRLLGTDGCPVLRTVPIREYRQLRNQLKERFCHVPAAALSIRFTIRAKSDAISRSRRVRANDIANRERLRFHRPGSSVSPCRVSGKDFSRVHHSVGPMPWRLLQLRH